MSQEAPSMTRGIGVERERPLLAGEVERHTLGEVRARQRLGATAQLVERHLGQRLVDALVGVARLVGFDEHLIPCALGAAGGAGVRVIPRKKSCHERQP
jgi:hypothetical protein